MTQGNAENLSARICALEIFWVRSGGLLHAMVMLRTINVKIEMHIWLS